MATTVNGHSVPQFGDTLDVTPKTEWDALETILTDCCTAINTSGQLTAGVTAAGTILAGASNGTAGTGFTAVEHGSSVDHLTVLTVDAAFGAIAGGADLGLGILAYTFPAGKIFIEAAYASLAFDEADGNITADTPDWGLGTVVASGEVAVLGGTATFENIMTGQTAADCNGTVNEAAVCTPLAIATAGAHTMYLNIADGWAASGETALPVAGTIAVRWSLVGA